jgi:Asp-tRNA(Asn)/Glu-tRNA(Gln) amidotransferase A subunit family amidase
MKQSTKGALGMPLAVQVVGRRYDEELVLRVMKELETLNKTD